MDFRIFALPNEKSVAEKTFLSRCLAFLQEPLFFSTKETIGHV